MKLIKILKQNIPENCFKRFYILEIYKFETDQCDQYRVVPYNKLNILVLTLLAVHRFFNVSLNSMLITKFQNC